MEKQKYVDESWKETAELEKEKLREGKVSKENDQQAPIPETQEAKIANHQEEDLQESAADVNFINYISSLAYQAMIFLGQIPHPMTNQYEKNFQQAKLLIDTLVMLRDKTTGNLTKQESDLLGASVYELQMNYVAASQKEENK